MSVIQRIRERAAWFVFGAIAISLIAFILQDAFSSNRGSMFSNSSTIGKVNGTSIDRTDFENKISFYQQANGAQRDQLIGNVWDYMVEQKVMEQEYDKLGLRFTSKELSDVLFGSTPPSWMQQAFTDPNTGVYNADAARQQFSQIKKNANDERAAQIYEGYIEPTMQQMLRQKYQNLISGAVFIPKWLAEKTNADNNSIAKISYISVPYSTISDSTVRVSDDEIEIYIKNHSKHYEQKEANRQIAYISFDASPSKEDSLEVMNQLFQLKNELLNTTDVKSFLLRNGSDIPFYDSYLSKSAAEKQNANDSLFNLSAGDVYGPYMNNKEYVLTKMVDVKQIPDSVKVRHILVSTNQPDQNSGQMIPVRDDSAALKRLDSAIALLHSGASFDSIAAVYSDDPGSNKTGGVYDYFPSGQMVEQFNDFAFTGKTGDTKVVQTSFGYHYIEILGQKGSQPAYKIAYFSKPVNASNETVDKANTEAIQFAAANRDRKSFDAAALRLNKPPIIAGSIKENDFTIPNLGDSRQLIRWIYDNDLGDVSEPMQVNDKYIVAVITGINKSGLMSVAEAGPTVEPLVRNEKKAQIIINQKIKGNTLNEAAKSATAAIQTADSISFQSYIIPNIGNEIKIVGAAFNKQVQTKMSAPIAGATGVFVIRGEGISAAASLGGDAQSLRESLAGQLKSQIGYSSMNALRDAADIKDYRSTFY